MLAQKRENDIFPEPQTDSFEIDLEPKNLYTKLKFRDTAWGRRVSRSTFTGTEEFQTLAQASSNREFIDHVNSILGIVKDKVQRKRPARDIFIQSTELSPKRGCGAQQEVEEKYEGEYKLSLEQLLPPPPCYRLREVNKTWVTKLTTDLLTTNLISTILPVMRIPEDPDTETQSSEQFWLLGGVHLVEALRSSAGTEKQILCHVYNHTLTQEEALRIATISNRKMKVQPLTFKDRIGIARRMRLNGADNEGHLTVRLKEVLGELEMKEIKDSLSTIVSVSRYSDRNYNLFCQMAETSQNMNQKIYKLLQAETEQTRHAVLQKALDCGYAGACQWLEGQKKEAALKRVFIKETGVGSWEEAIQNNPIKTKTLMEFKDVKIGKKNLIPEKILDFCKRAKENDYQNNISININIEVDGKEVKTNRLSKIIAEFEKKVKKELQSVENLEYEE